MKAIISFLTALFLVSLAPNFSSGKAQAAELVMMEQAGCAWCKRWHAEIGVAYPKTAEGRLAPLRQVDIHAPWPADLKDIQVDRYTPTFVLVENGKELGRLRGYAGDDFFWPLLAEMLANAGIQPSN